MHIIHIFKEFLCETSGKINRMPAQYTQRQAHKQSESKERKTKGNTTYTANKHEQHKTTERTEKKIY